MDKNKDFLSKLSQDQVAAMCLLANKIFNDYLICCKMAVVEPESYFEKWMTLHISSMEYNCKESVWKIFMHNIVVFRNSQAAKNGN
jgi:hypothetical protein